MYLKKYQKKFRLYISQINVPITLSEIIGTQLFFGHKTQKGEPFQCPCEAVKQFNFVRQR